jgi:hypothetical protein
VGHALRSDATCNAMELADLSECATAAALAGQVHRPHAT